MENTHSANIEKANTPLTLVQLNFEPEEDFLNFLQSQNISISTNNLNSQLILTKSRDNYDIAYQDKKYKCKKQNLIPFFKILLRSFRSTDSSEFNDLFIKQKIPTKSHTFFTLSSMAATSPNLEDFCRSLFKLEPISKYSHLNLIIQAKGETFSTSLEFSKENTKAKSIQISEFSKLFSAIKKSKNGSFGQSTLKSSDFEIIGTCLAKEFSLDEYNIILILSNNDFLPQQEENINNFNNICNYLSFFLNYFLKINYLEEQIYHNKKIVNLSDKTELIKKQNFNLFDVKHQERITLLGELLNTLRHELSNPLFGLELSASLLPLENLDENSKELAREIHLAIKRCQDIMNNFSELYSDKSTIQKTDIMKLIREVLILTKSKTKSILKTITLNDEEIPEGKEVYIKTNKTLLAQVIFNLVINSSQAMEDKTTDPALNINLNRQNGQYLQILISDNGPGLKANESEKIFSPFYTTKKDGTGLGLSICRDILSKLNGTIENLPSDNGAVFLLKLPYESTSR